METKFDKSGLKLSSRVIPAETRRKAAALFEEGHGYVRVANVLGLSKNTVKDWHRQYRAGTFHIVQSDKLRLFDEETKAWAILLRLSGLSWSQFEARTGISRMTCTKWMKNKGMLP